MLGPRRVRSFIMPYPLSGYAPPNHWMGPSTRAAWFTMRFVRDKWQRIWHVQISCSALVGPKKCWEHVMNLFFIFIVVFCCCFASVGGIWAANKNVVTGGSHGQALQNYNPGEQGFARLPHAWGCLRLKVRKVFLRFWLTSSRAELDFQ